MSQKAYDKQTAEFIAAVIRNFPILSSDAMQHCISNPSRLQKTVRTAIENDGVLKYGITAKVRTGQTWPPSLMHRTHYQLKQRGPEVHDPLGALVQQRASYRVQETSLVNVPWRDVVHDSSDVSMLAYMTWGSARGLSLCPLDTAISFFESQDAKRTKRQSLLFASPPLCLEGKRYLFWVEVSSFGETFIGLYDADAAAGFCEKEHVVFCADAG